MGNKQTIYGGLLIALEVSQLNTGETAIGTVQVSVTQPVSPGVLFLTFQGFEKTSWTTQTRHKVKGVRFTTNNYHGSTHKICKVSYPLFTLTEGLQPGGYSFPFTFVLPENIPSSFALESGSTKALITYKFLAEFKGNNNEVIKGSKEVQIRQPIIGLKTNLQEKTRANIKTWCCINQGTCEVDVDYPQDTYCPSQSATFHVITDNSGCSLPITGIKCDFSYNVLIRGEFNDSHLIVGKLITQQVPVNIPAGSSEQLKPVEFYLNLEQVRDKLEKMFTTKGNLVECVYWNTIEAEVDGSCICCGQYPIVKSNINIVPSIRVQERLPEKPPGWDPKVMDVVNLQYDERFDVPFEKKLKADRQENFTEDGN